MTSSPMISGSNSPDLSPLDYQVWRQCWGLITSCNWSQKQFPSLKMHVIWLILVCITRESHWELCERLLQATAGMRISQRWTFWTYL